MECSSILLLVANGSSQLHTMYQSRCKLRTPDDGQKDCPKKRRVEIPIKLEFSASDGFIHKEVRDNFGRFSKLWLF